MAQKGEYDRIRLQVGRCARLMREGRRDAKWRGDVHGVRVWFDCERTWGCFGMQVEKRKKGCGDRVHGWRKDVHASGHVRGSYKVGVSGRAWWVTGARVKLRS